MRLIAKIAWKLFHSNIDSTPVGEYHLTVSPQIGIPVIAVEILKDNAETKALVIPDRLELRKWVKDKALEFAQDTRYPIVWNEDTGLEIQFKEV